MMRFIDRTDEQARLRHALGREERSFIVMYGRRRLGKSRLIREVMGEGDIYYMAEKNEPAMQRALLQNAIAAVYPVFSSMRFPDWESLLTTLSQLCRPGTTLVLDEFPYLVKACKSLPSTLQRLIDLGQLRYNLLICGSSQRMMQRIVLDASEPLYGRCTERMVIRPIGIEHWRSALSLGARQAVEEFAVWGGVPRYWELRGNYPDFETALERLILDPNGVLYDEPSALFIEEEGNLQLFTSIMTALGNGAHQYSRLADAVGKKTTEISLPLRYLAEMGYVRREVPFGEAPERTKKALYQIDDPFMAFYYAFVAPYKSLLAIGRTEPVKQIIQARLNEHIGHLWERICQLSVSGRQCLGHQWMAASRWWGKVRGPKGETEDIELDVVAESMDKGTLLIGECKWTKADYVDRLLARLRHKASLAPFVKGREIVYVLFLREAPLNGSPVDAHILTPEEVIPMV